MQSRDSNFRHTLLGFGYGVSGFAFLAGFCLDGELKWGELAMLGLIAWLAAADFRTWRRGLRHAEFAFLGGAAGSLYRRAFSLFGLLWLASLGWLGLGYFAPGVPFAEESWTLALFVDVAVLLAVAWRMRDRFLPWPHLAGAVAAALLALTPLTVLVMDGGKRAVSIASRGEPDTREMARLPGGK